MSSLLLLLRPILSTNQHTAVFCKLYSFVYFFGGLEWSGHSFANVAHFVFLRDVWIRTQRAAVASRRAINLGTHLPNQGDGYVCYLLIFLGRFLKAQNVP
jgi:hypothetical protein